MIRSLYTAATGMVAQQLNMDVVAHNLSNVNTAGFKKSRAEFQDLLYQTLKAPGVSSSQETRVPAGIQVGLGTRVVATTKDFSTGQFQRTEKPLNMAIEGHRGFFEIILPSGESGYTRDGTFVQDSEGQIVTADGYRLNTDIIIPQEAEEISIGNDGTVTARMPGETEPEELGGIELTGFTNPAGLISIGRNLYVPSANSGDPVQGTPGQDGFGTLAQYFVEMSNVKVVDEMVNMIVAQRAYEVNSKAIQTSDDMLQVANNLKR